MCVVEEVEVIIPLTLRHGLTVNSGIVKTAAAFVTVSLGVCSLKHSLWNKGAETFPHFSTRCRSKIGKIKRLFNAFRHVIVLSASAQESGVCTQQLEPGVQLQTS